MDWIKGFYSKTGAWWGPAEAKITESDYRRVATIQKICGTERKTILELGCGYGNTAAATAEAGYQTTGIEISDRTDWAKQFVERSYTGSLDIIREDFYQVSFKHKFDIITYWNGFGVGTDADNRRLLKNIASEWLEDDGMVLMDVFNPLVWASWVGTEKNLSANPEEDYNFSLTKNISFDPVNNRFVDTWWETNKPNQKFSQTVRCYSPVDLALLLEGSGLRIERLLVGDEEFKIGADYTAHHGLLKNNYEYLAVLVKEQ